MVYSLFSLHTCQLVLGYMPFELVISGDAYFFYQNHYQYYFIFIINTQLVSAKCFSFPANYTLSNYLLCIFQGNLNNKFIYLKVHPCKIGVSHYFLLIHALVNDFPKVLFTCCCYF